MLAGLLDHTTFRNFNLRPEKHPSTIIFSKFIDFSIFILTPTLFYAPCFIKMPGKIWIICKSLKDTNLFCKFLNSKVHDRLRFNEYYIYIYMEWKNIFHPRNFLSWNILTPTHSRIPFQGFFSWTPLNFHEKFHDPTKLLKSREN